MEKQEAVEKKVIHNRYMKHAFKSKETFPFGNETIGGKVHSAIIARLQSLDSRSSHK